MTARKEPPAVAILAARIQRAYPALSPYSAASLAAELESIERAQRRHAERCCSGEDGGYVRYVPDPATAVHSGVTVGNTAMGSLARDSGHRRRIARHDPDAEQRAGERIERRVCLWLDRIASLHFGCASVSMPAIETEGDPRGAVLKLRLPGEGTLS